MKMGTSLLLFHILFLSVFVLDGFRFVTGQICLGQTCPEIGFFHFCFHPVRDISVSVLSRTG
jgi:hypothetical protein